MDKRYAIKVDIMKTPAVDGVTFNQQDRNSTVLVIAVSQNGQTVDLTGKQVSMAFRKPDGTIVTQDETNGITVTAPLTGTFEIELFTEVLTAQGKVAAEITITDGDSIVVLDPFSFKVNASIRNGAETISKNDLSFMANIELLESNYNAMYAKADAAKTAADAATTAAGTAQSTANAAQTAAAAAQSTANAAQTAASTADGKAVAAQGDATSALNQIGIVSGSVGVSAESYASLSAALTAIGTASKTLVISSQLTVSANTTIPSNVHLHFSKTGSISVNSGVTLTINGAITAGLWQIFSGSGTVNGNSAKIVSCYPEWFGAKINDQTVDNAPLFDKAQKFFPIVKLAIGDYYFQTLFKNIYAATFEGVGRVSNLGYDMTNIIQLSDMPTIQLDQPMFTMKNLTIKGVTTNPNNDGIYFPSLGSNSVFERVFITNCGRHGIYAGGTATYGIDLCHFKDIKISSNMGYGLKLDLAPGGSGFNTSEFELIECRQNQLGGFYLDNCRSLTFIRCHAFWNESSTNATVFGYTIQGNTNTANLKFINCWSESSGEHNYPDPKHQSGGFLVNGGKNINFDNCHTENEDRGFTINGGTNIIIDNPDIGILLYSSCYSIKISANANQVKVINYNMPSDAVVANFSSTSTIETTVQLPTSSRIPYNAYFKRGDRGKSHCYIQGTVGLYEIAMNGKITGATGTNVIYYTDSCTLRIGDNILVGYSDGSGLYCQIMDIDVSNNTITLSTATNAAKTLSGTASSNIASVYSEIFTSTHFNAAISGYWQVGDKIFTTQPDIRYYVGEICVKAGTPGTWEAFGYVNYQSASSFALGNAGQISTIDGSTNTITTSTRMAPTANVTGVKIQSGTYGGQEITVYNESAFTITFDVSGTSKVAAGTSEVIQPNTAGKFSWDAGTSLWYRIR